MPINRKKVLRFALIIVGALLLYAILALMYLIPHRRQLQMDEWYTENIETIALDYTSQIDSSKYELVYLSASYTYPENSREIVERNRGLPLEEKEYPFSNVEIEVLAGPQIYVLQLEKDEAGELKLLSYEIKKNYKYFY